MTGDADRINWPDLVREGLEARRTRDGAQWTLGDLAKEVETTYGGHELERYAEEIAVDFDTLQDYRYVAAAYAPSERSDNLSWSHHRVLAAKTDRLQWLQKVGEQRWSVRQLREQIRSADVMHRLEVTYDVALNLSDEWRVGAEAIIGATNNPMMLAAVRDQAECLHHMWGERATDLQRFIDERRAEPS